MFPRVFQTFTLLLISASLVSSSPAPVPAPEPIDATLAHVIAINKNVGCSGPSGCAATQNGMANAAEILATSGALSPSMSASMGSAIAAAVAVAGITALM